MSASHIFIFSTVVSETAPATNNKMDSKSAKKFTFNIVMFPAKEHSKDLKKRASKNTYMVLHNNEPLLLLRIKKILSPSKLDIADYEIHFTIARISPSPLMVSSNEEYTNMLKWVGKSKDLACNVYVQELCSSSKVGSWYCFVQNLLRFIL